MTFAANLGFPRIGLRRELKKALEDHWAGRSSEDHLRSVAKQLRADHWRLQQKAGIIHVPSNDFSFYDQVLDAAVLVGAIPTRFHDPDATVSLRTYFEMARGSDEAPALEMTKWFDTNYHYLVPEFDANSSFRLRSHKPVDEFLEAAELGIPTRPVLLGPVSFLLLGKGPMGFDTLELLDRLLPVYVEVLGQLAEAGAEWVQLDEPCLALDLPPAVASAYAKAYAALARVHPRLKLMLATYFGDLGEHLSWVLELPVAGVHLDLVRAPAQLIRALALAREDLYLSLGVVDGRNVWRTDLDQALSLCRQAQRAKAGDRLMVAPSCSLLHSPVDLALETSLDAELRTWLAFAAQKLEEVVVLSKALDHGETAVESELASNRAAMESRRSSPRTHNPLVRERVACVTLDMEHRRAPFSARSPMQQASLRLPGFPTTTIGSFPQTPEVRSKRAAFKAGSCSSADYETFLQAEITRCVRFQEDIGLDVLVHGEFERNDMVEHFGALLAGFALTSNGWVQSYGSRCVKPPLIYGDVSRPGPMTVAWSRYAQSLTKRPVKGMLTGPVTLLQWSFVRDDQPRSDTCRQIALALREEVADLEAAGIVAIQVDEPALREGLPLRQCEWPAYLSWSTACFRLATAVVRDETQIHTHMCYSQFNDIIAAIGELDADVISIECSRSHMELLIAFEAFHYLNEIGPGIYDVHSPRIPTVSELAGLLRLATRNLAPAQVWVNPDCGLKTRTWNEVEPALRAMVEAAQVMRRAGSSQSATGGIQTVQEGA